MLSSTGVKSVTQDLALIRHFREHLYALSDEKVIDLLSIATIKPVNNTDARSVFRVGRAGAWFRLSRLVDLGMLEKRGQAYRASQYSEKLIEAISVTFQSVLTGRAPQLQSPGWTEALRLASDGARMSYERGKVDQAEYTRLCRMLKELEAHLDVR